MFKGVAELLFVKTNTQTARSSFQRITSKQQCQKKDKPIDMDELVQLLGIQHPRSMLVLS